MSAGIDDEIKRLKAQVHSLRTEVKLQATALLSRPSAVDRILAEQQPRPVKASLSGAAGKDAAALTTAQTERIRERQRSQTAHDQQNLYRVCAGVTTFKVRDPDPNAVDGGSVLGIRIEVVRSARFLRPYYVLLNRPWAATATDPAPEDRPAENGDLDAAAEDKRRAAARRFLRVHRHTLPPAIPIAGLAARHLPAPQLRPGRGDKSKTGTAGPKRQDLGLFVRRLRREVVRYHHRLGSVADMRVAAGLETDTDSAAVAAAAAAAPENQHGIIDISAADTTATQLKIDWADGRVGRLVMGPGGELLRCVVFGPRGRDRATERDVSGGCTRIEDVVARLRSGGV